MNFYDNFLRLCNDVHKSPSRVILEVGGTKSAITRWKNGSMPTDATAKKIADYFDVSVDVLLGRVEQEEKEKPTVQDDGLSENHIKLIEIAKTLSDEDAAMLLAALQAKTKQ